MSPRILLSALRALCALSLAACSPDSTATAPAAPLPATIVIADPGVIRDGDVVQLNAAVRSRTGAPVPNASVQWTVTDTSVATISASGRLTALREGRTDIVAAAAGTAIQQRRSLTIVLHPATAIELDRTQLDLRVGEIGGVAATLRGLDGRVLRNRPLEWSSSDSSVVRVSGTGLLTALKGGAATITARYGSLRATLAVRVPAPSTVTDYRVTTVDGRPLIAIVDDRLEAGPDGTTQRYITRLEEGTLTLGREYQIELKLATYLYSELGGNVIMRLINRTTLRDAGTIEYNFITQEMTLISTRFGSVRYRLSVEGTGTTLTYREPGTDQVWKLGLMRKTP